MCILNDTTAIALGYGILKTSDKGITWQEQSGGIDTRLYGVCFTDKNTGTAVGSLGGIYRTTNAGKFWEQQYHGGPTLLSVDFADTNNGFATGYEAQIFRTSDGGKHWVKQFDNGFYLWFNSISVTDANHATAVGQGGRILRTNDGGTNWILQHENSEFNLYGVAFIDNSNGFAVGTSGKILHTKDAGNNWESIIVGDSYTDLYSVSFFDLNNGLAVGDEVDSIPILKTTDGGLTWKKIPNSITESLYDVQFVSSSIAYTVGNRGIIYKSNDGGLNWVKQDSAKTSGLHSVSFIDELNGTAVGVDGVILHTTDGGGSYLGIDDINYVSTDLIVYQNYPNPFNGISFISWEQSQNAPIVLKVTDLSGRKIKTLLDCYQESGKHTQSFDVSDMADGIYFLTVQMNKHSITKKLILSKNN